MRSYFRIIARLALWRYVVARSYIFIYQRQHRSTVNLAYPKVYEPESLIGEEENIIRFDVSMNDLWVGRFTGFDN